MNSADVLPATLVGLRHEIATGAIPPRRALELQAERAHARAADLGCVVRWLDLPPDTGSDASLPLAGIALAHKDIFDLDGWAPGCGHDHGTPDPARRAATAVARLRDAGARQLATLAMAEYACGATARNARLATCRHPLHADAVVGGSSSGSAVAVASGLVYGSLGSDSAGSVRIPAATCGVLGLKPTHGACSGQGMAPLAPALDTPGLLARDADDLALLWSVVADRAPPPAPAAAPRLKTWLPPQADAAVLAALEAAARRLGSGDFAPTLEGQPIAAQLADVVLHAQAGASLAAPLRTASASPTVRAVALPGAAMPGEWLATALQARARVLNDFMREHFARHDVLLLPALQHPVPDARQVDPDHADFDARLLVGLHRYMGFLNYLGLPALVLPVARDARGLPLCLQAVARPSHEAQLLAIARRWQADASRDSTSSSRS